MKIWSGFTLIIVTIYVVVGQESSEEECFTTEWALGLVSCALEKFEPLLDLIPMPASSSSSRRTLKSIGTNGKQPKDRLAQPSKWYKLMHGMTEVHDDYQQALLSAMGGRVPHTKQQKEREEISKKLLKIDINELKKAYVSSLLQLNRELEERLESLSGVNIYTSQENMNKLKAEPYIYDTCMTFCSLLESAETCQLLCRVLDSANTCLQNYNETDFEDNLKWVRCFYECSDMGPLSQCFAEKFEGCGIGWPLNNLDWLGHVAARTVVEYFEFDQCLLNVISPAEVTVEEGGESQLVEFNTYLPPSVLCLDVASLNNNLGLIQLLVQWINGNIGECNVRVTLTTSNYVNLLLSKRIQVPVLGTVQLGRPPCRDNTMIRQAVIGTYDHVGEENGILTIENTNWNETFAVPVRATVDGKNDGDITDAFLTLKLKAGLRTLQTVKIPLTVIDRDISKSQKAVSTCSVINDPHITSFDQFYYSNYYDGHFTLYQHHNYSYEVQAVFQSCGIDANVSCTCGVSVRAGDDVFVVDRCRRVSDECPEGICEPRMRVELYTNGELTPGTRIFKKLDGLQYEVLLPHGTMVTITTSGVFLNVWIRPSTYDLDRSFGLCGVYNGDITDDLTLPNGTVYTGEGATESGQPRPFNKAWRVPAEHRIFWGVEAGSGVDRLEIEKHCVCSHTVVLGTTCDCGYDKLVEDCDIDTSGEVAPEDLPMYTQSSLAQMLANDEIEFEDDLDINENYEPPEYEWESNSDMIEARTFCRSLMSDNDMLKACRSLLFPPIFPPSHNILWVKDINGCMDDILVSGSREWAPSALESAKQRCRDMMQLVVDESKADVDNVLMTSCIHECNNQGSCINGTCVCSDDFDGPDCSIPADSLPFMSMEGATLCNTRNEQCQYAKVFGGNFLEKYMLECQVQQVVVSGDGIVDSKELPMITNVTYISSNQIACFLPSMQESYRVFVTSSDPIIRASMNMDGSFVQLTYDGACYECDTEDPSCSRKDEADHCIIQDICYAQNEYDPEQECYWCDAAHLNDDWSVYPSSECEEWHIELMDEISTDERNEMIKIITATVLSATVALIALILFLFVGRIKNQQRRLKRTLSSDNASSSGSDIEEKPIPPIAEETGFYNEALVYDDAESPPANPESAYNSEPTASGSGSSYSSDNSHLNNETTEMDNEVYSVAF